MFKALSEWWNRDKIRADKAMEELERYSNALTQSRQEADALNEQRVVLEQQRAELIAETVTLESELETHRTKAAEDEARRNGTEPWVEIKSERIDPVKGIQIELDWNDAFIQYLKESGITGRDEETVVQKWIAFLYQDLLEKLEQQVIDNSDKKRPGDFE